MQGGLPPVGALVRRPALLVRRRVMTGLYSAGFSDLLPGHLAVFQYPGPEGQRPGVLAARSELSKQAMNHLLTQLEKQGYLTREADPADRRTKVIRLTARGEAAQKVIDDVVSEIEVEWERMLGASRYGALQLALHDLEIQLGDRSGGDTPFRL